MSNLQAKTNPRPKPKSRKLSLRAKTAATALSFSALIGGWNIVGHFEANAHPAGNALDTSAQRVDSAVSLPDDAAIPPLNIAPVPTLPAIGDHFANGGAQTGGGLLPNAPAARLQMPAPPALAPLPALPALPTLPAVPTGRRLRRRSGSS